MNPCSSPSHSAPASAVSTLTAASVPLVQRRRSTRDLAHAVTLRPRDIFELYGIPSSTLCRFASRLAPEQRPPSKLLRGMGGRKGIRLFPRAEFERWIARFAADGTFAPVASETHPASRAPRRPKPAIG